ncbi:hypothetical protein LG296_20870 (plasmid) [Ureibacillus chungkukjangi]|uniref:hypothetical protein n=1 Tax=Ureibacillus chungkukjangi TaxID=1202712 RepID=UPI000D38E0A6|nr:hypothetical protein [Ureibacillus chungkukjangi]MCM3390008.1 hypothetical protein [Ureibacillus chungkukjangi]
MKTKKVSAEQIYSIIETYQPLGLFYYQESQNLYVAVDNSDGKAWTEEFKSEQDCIKWLTQEHLLNTEIAELTNLTESDFQLLDVVVTVDYETFTIGPKTNNSFLSAKDAFSLYQQGQIISKTVEMCGEPIFFDVKKVS